MGISTGEVATASDVNIALEARTKYATGNYTGDGTDDRQITVGFECINVFVRRGGGSSYGWLCYSSTESMRCILGSPATVSAVTDLILHTSDGFVVDNLFANASTASYTYTAIGTGD